MSIDSGQNITYNANYPVPNVDQSSQQFRDNFLITKTAIENIQNAASTNASVLSITTSMAGQAVQFNVGYKNNALILPSGNPNPNTPSNGMIRYNSGEVEFYAGGQWNAMIYKTPAGIATVPSLVVNTKATVPVAVASTDATQYSQLLTEITNRQNGDLALAAEIANVAANAATAQDLEDVANNAGAFGAQIANNAAAIAQETADRIANDALLAADIANAEANVVTLSSTVDGAYSTANAAFDAANAAANNTGFAQSAFNQANTALSTASGAFSQANTALTTANGKVSKTGDSMTGALSITSGLYVNDITANSSIYCSGDITAFSDMALKYNIETIGNALAIVNQLRGTTFNRADLEGNPRQVGFIAQELQQIVPEVVHEHPSNGLLSVSYGNLVALLVEAVKELSREVAELKAR
jgi:hypothetical protein